MHKILIILVFLSQFFQLYGQPESIAYESGLIDWSLYLASPTSGSSLKAFSSFEISYSVGGHIGNYHIAYNCSINSRASWVKPYQKNVELLHHEQKLFDLWHLYSLKMDLEMKKFLKEKGDSIESGIVISQVQDIYKQYYNLLFEQQNLYNAQTNNGTVRLMQKKWDEKIDNDITQVKSMIKEF